MSALLLTAVVGTRGKTSVALTADHLLAVELLGKSGQGRLNHSSSHLEEHFKGGLRRNSVGTDGLGVLKLLSGKDKALLVVVNVLSLLDHLLDVLHGLGGLNLKRDGVSLQRHFQLVRARRSTYSHSLEKELHAGYKGLSNVTL